MTSGQVLDIFRATGALLEGHFLYTSGRHGAHFVQASRVLQFPNYTERLCKAMAEKWTEEKIELVVGPATGGIILPMRLRATLNAVRSSPKKTMRAACPSNADWPRPGRIFWLSKTLLQRVAP